MIDAKTGQPTPCPNCGSRNVRWRRRGVHDVLFTWIRGYADMVLGWITSAGARPSGVGYPSERASEKAHVIEYNVRRNFYEGETRYIAPDRFWKCSACGQHGYVFDHLPSDLDAERADLAAREDQIRAPMGVIIDPVDRDVTKDS